jgi:acetylornithine aminotransferase/acetylornithine/N-succinyldiaminopimelate aminotransferase
MELNEIIKLDEQYYFGVFGKRFDVKFERGEGVYLYDSKGRQYTDFLAGIAVNCLGYADEGYVETLTGQLKKLIHLSNYFYNEDQALLAQMLCEKTGFDKAFFTNSGAESNEGAMKLALKYSFDKGENRTEFISVANSFHGRTLATLSATGQDKFHAAYHPLPYAHQYIPLNDLEAAEKAITDKTCAVIMEPIQGEGGIIEATPEFAAQIRACCDKMGALLIVDEVQTGMGRTGKFLASEHIGLAGDIVTIAKALGNGIPMGAILARDNIAAAFQPGDHGSTFAGGFLACAAGLYVMRAIYERNLMEKCAILGDYLTAKLNDLKDTFPLYVREVRGRGLLLGMELDESIPAKDVQKIMLHGGFLVCTAGCNTLRFLPPYIISKEDIDRMTDRLEKHFYSL